MADMLAASSRAERDAGAPGPAPAPAWARAILRVSLGTKLAGANALVVAVAALAALWAYRDGAREAELLGFVLATLVASLAINLTLVRVALRPLRELEAVAERLGRGDSGARVPSSPLADRDVARVGDTLNALLERLVADRARMRDLATQAIRAGEEEQARIARELHDSTAQTLTALVLQAGAASRDDSADALAGRLRMVRELAAEALDEVRTLSHTIHPRVLDDLGLVAALESLARRARDGDGVTATVHARVSGERVPRPIASVLYRVAQEALGNATRHGGARSVRITLTARAGRTELEVADDGRGFDVAEARRRGAARARGAGGGLFTMEERVALVDGVLDIRSAPGLGTQVHASVPLAPSAL